MKLAKGGSRFWARMQDLFLAMSSAHDHRPSAVRQAAAETGVGRMPLYQLRHSGASMDMARQYRMLKLSRKEELGRMQRARTGTNAVVAADNGKVAPDVRTLCEECEKYLREIMLRSRHPVTRARQELFVFARSKLRAGCRGCRQRGKLRFLRWNPSGRYFAYLFAGGMESIQARSFGVQAWDTVSDTKRV